MSSTASSRTSSSRVALAAAALVAGCTAPAPVAPSRDPGTPADSWSVELERNGTVLVGDTLDIDVPAGATVWLERRLDGPVEIEFDATAISAGGVNDQVSDLNVFWMATNRDGSAPLSTRRSGKFADYDTLKTYYVGLGGNRNSTTRFRRYVGESGNRPLLPEHDLSAPDTLLVANRKQTITLVANGKHVEYRRDGKTLFAYEDPAPYTSGWFAVRTTWSHLRIENVRIRSLRR